MALTVEEIHAQLGQALSDDAAWRKAAEADLAMYRGEQWNKDALAKLEAQKRPALVINKLKPRADMLTNTQIANRLAIRYLPKAGGVESTAEILTTLAHDIDDNSLARHVEEQMVADGNIVGRGWGMLQLDFTDDMLGTIVWRHCDSLSIIPDPTFTEPDLSDCEFVFRREYLSRGAMEEIYGRIGKEVSGVYEDPNTTHIGAGLYTKADLMKRYNKFEILEYWYRDYVKRWFFINRATGEMREEPDEEAAQQLVRKARALGLRQFFHAVRKAPRIKLVTTCGDAVLTKGNSPFGGNIYPAVPYFASWGGNVHQGIVRAGRDVQRELNKRRSELLALTNTAANAIWLILKGMVERASLEEQASQPAGIVEVGHEGTGLPLDAMIRRLDPAAPSPQAIAMAQMTEQDLKDVTGMDADILGLAGQKVSGRAINLRLQQQNKALGQYASNFKLTRELKGKLILAAIQHHYTFEKTFRILGRDKESFEEITINEMVRDPRFPGVTRILNDVTVGKYDVVVAEEPDSPTQRIADLATIIESLRDLSKFAAFPPILKAVLKYLPVAHKDELVQAFDESFQMMSQQAATRGGGTSRGGPATIPGTAPPT